jgi:hypothetical protein
VRIPLNGDERCNFVPVDWVSEVVTHIVTHPDHHGRTYHLTPDRPVSAVEVHGALANYFRYAGPVFAGPEAFAQGDCTEMEKMYAAHVARYQLYTAEDPAFDCTNTRSTAPHLPCPPIDEACLRRLLDFAIRDNWGRGGQPEAVPSGLNAGAVPSNRFLHL